MKKPLSKRHEIIAHMPYTLLHVLIKHKALNLYICNTVRTYSSFPAAFHNTVKELMQAKDVLIDSFYWRETAQGADFWNNITNEYYEELLKK